MKNADEENRDLVKKEEKTEEISTSVVDVEQITEFEIDSKKLVLGEKEVEEKKQLSELTNLSFKLHHQNNIGKKIISYLKKEGRDPKFITEFEQENFKKLCYGLTGNWLHAMWLMLFNPKNEEFRDDLTQFRENIQEIVNWDEETELKESQKKIFEIFIGNVLSLADPTKIFPHESYHQRDLEKTLVKSISLTDYPIFLLDKEPNSELISEAKSAVFVYRESGKNFQVVVVNHGEVSYRSIITAEQVDSLAKKEEGLSAEFPKLTELQQKKLLLLIEKNISINKLESFSGLFAQYGLQKMLEDYIEDEHLIFIGAAGHATGIIKKGEYYYFYDSDFDPDLDDISDIESAKLDLEKMCIACKKSDLAQLIFKMYTLESSKPAAFSVQKFSFKQVATSKKVQDLFTEYASIISENGYDNDTTGLMVAANDNDFYSLDFYLKNSRHTLNFQNNEGNTALHLAIKENNLEVVTRLLAEKLIEVNKANNNGRKPLMIAAQRGYKKIVEELLKQPTIDVNAFDHQGFSALYAAARINRLDIMQLLIAKGAKDTDGRILKLAVGKKQTDIVRFLLETGSVSLENIKKIMSESTETKSSAGSSPYSLFTNSADPMCLLKKAVEVNNEFPGSHIGVALIIDEIAALDKDYRARLSENLSSKKQLITEFSAKALNIINKSYLNKQAKKSCLEYLENCSATLNYQPAPRAK